MSVKGSLESLGLEDLLQADLASQGAGRLTLRHGPHVASLFLDEDGLVIQQPDLMHPDTVIAAFVRRGMLDPDVLGKARRRHLQGALLIDALVEEGHLPEAPFLETLAAEVEDAVLDMMLWDDGWFRYEPQARPQTSLGLLGRICVDPMGVTQRALQRVDERRAMADVLGRHAILFFAEMGDLPPPRDDHDPVHFVHACLDGRAVVHEIALHLGRSRFEILQTMLQLVQAGLARPATTEELASAIGERGKSGEFVVARHLALQWAELTPDDPAPLHRLVSLAAKAGERDAELEARCALGHLHLHRGQHPEALAVFTEAMRSAPADEVVLAGLRVAAEATGDNSALVDSTLLTAQTLLDEGKADDALSLLEPLARSHPTNISVHLLRARAMVQGQKRAEFCEHAEEVGRVLASGGCKTKEQREAATFFRETIAHVAPDRGDLLERFRALYDPRTRRRRAALLVVAFLALAAGAGVYLWPPGAAKLLEQAQAAANAGDRDEAGRIIADLVARFPDAPETGDAYLLQAQLFPPKATVDKRRRDARALQAALAAQAAPCAAALEALPRPEAREQLATLLAALGKKEAKSARKRVLGPLLDALRASATRLQGETMRRLGLLVDSAKQNDILQAEATDLRKHMEAADGAADATWLETLQSSAEVLYDLSRLHEDGEFRQRGRELVRAGDALAKAAAYYQGHRAKLSQALTHKELEHVERLCREEAPKLMVEGRLREADALYTRLENLLAGYAQDPLQAEFLQNLQRRGLHDFLRERRGVIAEIDKRLAAAAAEEQAGHLDRAVQMYADLVREHWLIRFDAVFELPLRLESVPAGARVLQDGKEIGRTPTVVRYPWGSERRVTLEAPGFERVEHKLATSEETPPSTVTLRLRPAPRWHAETGAHERVHVVGGHVLAVDRRGRVRLRDPRTGAVRWHTEHTSLEGVRGAPAAADGRLYVPHVDGHVYVLGLEDGLTAATLELPRLQGDAATVGSRVAVLSTDGVLIVLERGAEVLRAPLDIAPTAGVLGAHGAFWVGTLDGTVLRVEATGGKARTLQVAAKQASIVALTAGPDGVVAETANGAVVALDAAGATRWRRADLGDLVGAPVRVGAALAVVDRTGHVTLLDAADGTPRGTHEVGGRPRGAVAAGGTLLVLREDGRLWALDASTGHVLVDVDAAREGAFAPVVVPGAGVLLPWGEAEVALIPTPAAAR